MRIPRRLPVYPMGDNEDFFFGTDNDVNVYWDGASLVFDGPEQEFRLYLSTAGETLLKGGAVAGDDLSICANSIDVYPTILMMGASDVEVRLNAAAYFVLRDNGVISFAAQYDGNQVTLWSFIDAKDLYLRVTGAGYVKFGTRTGTGDVVCNGHLDIKDAAGNVVKLMTCA